MKRSIALVLALAAAGCTADSLEPTAALNASAEVSAAKAGEGVEESVTGHAEHTFFGGELLRNVSFSARKLPNGEPQGRFHVTLQGPAEFTGALEDGTRAVTFDVTCLEVEGNRAWIGGRIVAPKTDRYLGGEDVWVVEDGGETGPDRVAVFIGRAASRCSERPLVSGPPSERGELVVRDDS
jgi:hypothetical protein